MILIASKAVFVTSGDIDVHAAANEKRVQCAVHYIYLSRWLENVVNSGLARLAFGTIRSDSLTWWTTRHLI